MSVNSQNKLIQGCYTPESADKRALYNQLVQSFAPVVYFDPAERFFPVDLPSAIANSELWKILHQTSGDIAMHMKPVGQITPDDLLTADSDNFTTVAGITMETDQSGTIQFPVPNIQDIYLRYMKGEIPARLTMYATICMPAKVPNYQILDAYRSVIGEISKGLILSYYFYFPALESAELKREGDWSAISLLFNGDPIPSSGQVEDFGKISPILTFYYKKIGAMIVTDPDGIREWKDVSKLQDQNSQLETHPAVFISKGLHNCYYEPVNTIVPLDPVFGPACDPQKVEDGSYLPGPEVHELTTYNPYPDWLTYIPVLWPFLACGTVCGSDFDPSALPGGEVAVVDSTDPGGYGGAPVNAGTGLPQGDDTYPSDPPDPNNPIALKLNVVYVDLFDELMNAIWSYGGFWGAAECEDYISWVWMSDTEDLQYSGSKLGHYGGFERPNIAPWLIWDLYFDPIFGSDGSKHGYNKPGP